MKLVASHHSITLAQVDPNHVPTLRRLAWLHTQRRFEMNAYGAYDDAMLERRDSDAEECYTHALAVEPANAAVHAAFGSFLYHLSGDLDRAQVDRTFCTTTLATVTDLSAKIL